MLVHISSCSSLQFLGFWESRQANVDEKVCAKARKIPHNRLIVRDIWRSGWDSNPRAVARKLISSQPRYDHFDTTP